MMLVFRIFLTLNTMARTEVRHGYEKVLADKSSIKNYSVLDFFAKNPAFIK